MTKQTFGKGIAYLNIFYTNFKVDIENPLVIEIWFDIFKDMDDQKFTELVKGYCKENIYPPQSPTHLLEYAKKQLIETKGSADREFEYVRELNKRYSLRINYDTIYLKIDNPITLKLVKEMFEDFIRLDEDTVEQTRFRFIKRFNEYAKDEVQIESNKMLGYEKSKLLE